jgi:predicted house-cleaning noncanonical NTP pyrophosphatase (MazG superfamily)
MKETIFNKLVRNNILEILDKKNCKYTYKIMDDEDYKASLYSKFYEESIKFINNASMEKLADILEIIYSVLKFNNKYMDELESIRLDKIEKEGSFDKRIFLKKIMKE